jgi:hypothetical protein
VNTEVLEKQTIIILIASLTHILLLRIFFLSFETPSDLLALANASQLQCPQVDVAGLEQAFLDKAHEIGFPPHQEETPNVSQKDQLILPPTTMSLVERPEVI